MKNQKNRHSWPADPFVLLCAGAIAILHVGCKPSHPPQRDALFAAKFAQITPGDTAGAVEGSLGRPAQVTKSQSESNAVSTTLPVTLWHYSAGGIGYFIRFEPPGLDHWDDPAKWEVVLKGTEE